MARIRIVRSDRQWYLQRTAEKLDGFAMRVSTRDSLQSPNWQTWYEAPQVDGMSIRPPEGTNEGRGAWKQSRPQREYHSFCKTLRVMACDKPAAKPPPSRKESGGRSSRRGRR